MYGAVTTPPLPAVVEEQNERVISIRKMFERIAKDPACVLCIAPEGRDFKDGILGLPPKGSGKLIFHLAVKLKTILPVGVWESHGRLILNFGRVYSITCEKEGEGIDASTVSLMVMEKIAELLPNSIRREILLEGNNEKS